MFGDDIVNELVEWLNQVDLAFRSDLHQANEHNFQRLEAKLDQRCAEIRSELSAMKAELIKWMFLFWCGSVGIAAAAWLLK